VLARIGLALAGVVWLLIALAPAFLGLVALEGGLTNECIGDGDDQPDCYTVEERALLFAWAITSFAAAGAVGYAGVGGIYWAIEERLPPYFGRIAAAGAILWPLAVQASDAL
jgi:hypothetical protein